MPRERSNPVAGATILSDMHQRSRQGYKIDEGFYSQRTLLNSNAGLELIDLNSLIQAAECLRVLAHPHRLRIVELLLRRKYTVGELAEACGIQSNMASGHLKLMERCGLLRHERNGRSVFYQIDDSCVKEIMACIKRRYEPKSKASAPG